MKRRTLTMNNFTIGRGAAAVVVLGFIGAQLIGSSAGGIGDAPSPSSEASMAEATPTQEPSASVRGGLPAGSQFAWCCEHAPIDSSFFDVTITTPAAGWGDPPERNNAEPPDGAAMIMYTTPFHHFTVFGDPCERLSTTPDERSRTVDEVVAALGNQASRSPSAAQDIAVDGYAGRKITLYPSADAGFSSCDEGVFASFDGHVTRGPGQVDEMWVLDVNGTLAIIDVLYWEGTPATYVDELHMMIETLAIEER